MNIDGRLYLNGRFVPPEEARISVDDRGFQFGDGVYEVIRIHEGRPFLLDEHLARLERSLAGIEIPLPEPLDRLAALCRDLAATRRAGTLYLQVTRGVASRRHVFPAGVPPTLLAYASASGPTPERLRLKSVPDDRWGRCHLKTLNLLANVLAKEAAVRAGADEGLFVRDDGLVTEGCASNAFLVRDGTLFTHPATPRILGGITRALVVRLAVACGIPVRETPYSLEEALRGDELFMTGTTLDVAAVGWLDGRRIGDVTPGPLTRKLQEAFQEHRRSV